MNARTRWTVKLLSLPSLLEAALPALLPADQLVELNRAHFDSCGEFFTSEASRGLFPAEARVIDGLGASSGRALCVGCGAGREVFALTERGYDVVGVEPVGALVRSAAALAARSGSRARFVEGCATRLAELPLGEEPFELATLVNIAYSYIPTRAERVKVLAEIRRRLSPSGRCLVSFVSEPPSRAARWLELAMRPATLINGNRGYELGDRLVGNGNFIHFFESLDAVGAEAREAGFGRSEFFRQSDCEPLGVLSP